MVWLPSPLPQQGPHINTTTRVSSILNDEGGWDLTPIQDLISQQDKDNILSIYRPRFVTFMDTPLWQGSSTGNHSTSAAYKAISEQDDNGQDWQWIWKIQAPQRLKSFLWLVMHGRLLTNQMRLIRNLSDSDICPRCMAAREDMDHLLRGCSKAKTIWIMLKGINWWHCSNNKTLADWIKTNMKSKDQLATIKWLLIFLTALWTIWKERNKTVFDNLSSPPHITTGSIFKQAQETQTTFNNILHPNYLEPRLTTWLLPLAGKLKLNTDGCSKGDPGQSGYGGLLRDEAGS